MTHPTIGELFPADDPISRWVFTVTAAAYDIATAETTFRDALDQPIRSPRDFTRTGYRFRQLVARIFEARRPIKTADESATVAAFLGSVPDAETARAYLASVYLPIGSSAVDDQLSAARNRTVHLAWADSDELTEALERSAAAEARALVDHEAGTLSYEWPEAIAMRWVAGETNTPEGANRFVSRVDLARRIVRAYGELATPVLAMQCERRGVDRRRLYFEVESNDAEPGVGRS